MEQNHVFSEGQTAYCVVLKRYGRSAIMETTVQMARESQVTVQDGNVFMERDGQYCCGSRSFLFPDRNAAELCLQKHELAAALFTCLSVDRLMRLPLPRLEELAEIFAVPEEDIAETSGKHWLWK